MVAAQSSSSPVRIMRIQRPSHATIVAYLALFAALGGSSYAAVDRSGSASDTVTLCSAKSTGAVSLADGGHCSSDQRKVVVSKSSGPATPGLQGVPGDSGAAGGAGPAGAAGTAGTAGAPGATGPTGATGTPDTSDFYTQSQSNSRYAPLADFGSPVAAIQGTSTDSSCVVGEIKLSAGTFPNYWMLANGQALSTTTYSGLYAAIGYNYGGSGATFDLPNLSAVDPKGTGSAGVKYYICSDGSFP